LKVFISVDMEGATGVTTWEDVIPGKMFYNQSRKLLTKDVNSAIEGALEAGATEILVNESHDGMRNLLLDEINPKARVVRGFGGKQLVMMEGINESFDRVFLMSYHARAGTLGAILNHTLLGEIFNFWINGVLVGEGGISAAIAGHFSVPVAMVTGDDKVIKEMQDLLGNNFESVEVKKGISRYSADCIPPEVTSGLIRDAAKRAMSSKVKPYKVKSPCTIEVEFTTLEMGNVACWVPGIERVEPRKIKCTAENVVAAWKPIWASILLASGMGTRE
jgi:D-amino peptidase